MDILQVVFSNTIVAFIVLIGIVVFVHELGHFIAGKIFGIQVEEFSIGFGPKAFAFKHDNTEYRINWLPLGGYVRFYGADIEENIPLEQREKSILHAKVYKRAIVSFAGPFANFILSLVIMTGMAWHGLPKQPAIVSVLPGSVAEKSGLETGDLITTINQNPVKDWTDLSAIISKSGGKNLSIEYTRASQLLKTQLVPTLENVETLFGNTQPVGRIGVTGIFSSAGVVALNNSFFKAVGLNTGDKILAVNETETNYLFEVQRAIQSYSATTSELELAKKIVNNKIKIKEFQFKFIPIQNSTSKTPKTISVNLQSPEIFAWAKQFVSHQQNDPWEKSILTSDLTIGNFLALNKGDKEYPALVALRQCGLQIGDTIQTIKDIGIVTSLSQVYIHFESATKKNVTTSNGKSFSNFQFGVLKSNGNVQQLSCQMPLRTGYDHLNREKLFLDFPVQYLTQSTTVKANIDKAQGFSDAFTKGFDSLSSQIALTFNGIKMLFSGSIPLSNLGGPIAIANAAGDAAKGGLLTFLIMMAFISTNIGMMNLLPLPALDGGALLLHGVEAAYGKQLPKGVQLFVQRAGILLIISLFILVFYNDILRMLRF